MDNNILNKRTKLEYEVGNMYVSRHKEYIPILAKSTDNYITTIAIITPLNIKATDEDKANAAFICKAVNNYDSLLEENSKLKRLLEDLTPGGSEFVNDPEYCAKFVREYIQSVPKQVLPFKQRADKLKEINDSLLSTLEEVYGMLIHEEGDLRGNKAKTDIFKYCPKIGELYNKMRQVIDKNKAEK